jgi:hypothetical protein
MSSPYSAGRDSNNPPGNAFDAPTSDVADEHLSSFRDSFRPPSDRLSEQDYRQPESGGGAGFEDVTVQREPEQNPQRFTYPVPGRGGAL